MGSPLRGRGSFVLDRNEGLVSPFGSGALVSFLDGPRTSVCGVSARPVPQGVLPGGPRCVHEQRLFISQSKPRQVMHTVCRSADFLLILLGQEEHFRRPSTGVSTKNPTTKEAQEEPGA